MSMTHVNPPPPAMTRTHNTHTHKEHTHTHTHPFSHIRLEEYKWRAVVTEIKRIHAQGRPVLVGTTSVEKSELLSGLLAEEGIRHQVCLVEYGGSVQVTEGRWEVQCK